MQLKRETLENLADMVCGNGDYSRYFRYRSSSYLTGFFQDVGLNCCHNGTTRKWWVRDRLVEILDQPSKDRHTPPRAFSKVIEHLMEVNEQGKDEDPGRRGALGLLNQALTREGLEAYYSDAMVCYLRAVGSSVPIGHSVDPHRPLTPEEDARLVRLSAYIDQASEDELTEMVILPLLKQLGFRRITVAGHKDKSLEYGKDVWMKYQLPTQHFLYFGIQVKKGKLDAAASTRTGHSNVGEVHNQISMMLGHPIFDPETNRKVLVDHAFIVAGGEITKAARNWIGTKLDATKRSQILFMDRTDLLRLYTVTNLPVPNERV